VPAHRSHGLGLWIKSAMLVALRAERPDVTGIGDRSYTPAPFPRSSRDFADDSSPDHGESITSREPSSMSGHRGARSRVGGL
jgi:hypothetical protein